LYFFIPPSFFVISVVTLLSLRIGYAQELNFGLDLRANSNFVHSFNNKSSYAQQVQVSIRDPYLIQEPSFNFGFLNDELDTVYVFFNETRLVNNIEFPIYGKFISKGGWMFGLSFSVAKYKLEFDGQLSRSGYYFLNELGGFDDFVSNYGGSFDSTAIDNDPNHLYNDTTAYLGYFNSAVANNPYSQAKTVYREEFKFNSLYVFAGYRFLNHKLIRPYFTIGAGLITSSKTFSRQYFDIQTANSAVTTKKDLSLLSADIPAYSNIAIGTKLDIGLDLYRYHLGISGSFAFNMRSDVYQSTGDILEEQLPGLGNGAISLFLGVDLFTLDLRSKNLRNEIFKDEFSSLGSSLNKNRSFEFAVHVEAPVMSRMTNYNDFSFINYTDVLDPENPVNNNKRWESLAFKEIKRVNWSPALKVGGRFGIMNKWKLEAFTGFSQLEVDTEVQEFKTSILLDTMSGQLIFDSTDYRVRQAVFRSRSFPLQLGMNAHYKLYDNGILRLNLFAGAALNYILTAWRISRDPGINGKGEDVYRTVADYYWLGTGVESQTGSWHSDYAGLVDVNDGPDEMLTKYNNVGMTRLSDWQNNRRALFFSARAGFELEINKVLFGLNGDFSISETDNVFTRHYFNLNLSLGYLFGTKSKIDKGSKSNLKE
jgi:hypothetical protein